MGSPLQYPCIKLAGAAPFGELCSFKKSLKNFRAMCADTEKHVLPRLDTRGKKANFNRCEAKRLKSPALSCQDARIFLQDARVLKPISAPQAPRVAGDFTQSHSCTFAGGNISFKSAAIIIKLILRRIPTALSLRCTRRPFCRPFCLSLPACAAP